MFMLSLPAKPVKKTFLHNVKILSSYDRTFVATVLSVNCLPVCQYVAPVVLICHLTNGLSDEQLMWPPK